MAIPVKFQQFKSAGIYRLVYDKSVINGVEAELLRLVVGYSPKGPFNTPVYIKTVSDFTAMFGGISKTLEKRGCFFHRTCIQALEAGPILCLNLKKFSDAEQVGALNIGEKISQSKLKVTDIYDTSRFWKLEPEKLSTSNLGQSNLINMSATDSIETTGTVFIRKAPDSKVRSYNMSLEEWYKAYNQEVPEYVANDAELLASKLSDLFTEIYVFSGKFDETVFSTSLAKYFQKEVKEVLVSSEKELRTALNDSEITNIILSSDITLKPKSITNFEDSTDYLNGYDESTTITIIGTPDKPLNKVIDLNGKTVKAGVIKYYASKEAEKKNEVAESDSVAFYINNANVTFKGKGSVIADNADYSMAIWATGGSNVKILDGTYSNGGDSCDLVYVSGESNLEVYGGTFNASPRISEATPGTKNYCTALNCKDGHGTIKVYGGSFKAFNPYNNLSETNHYAYQPEESIEFDVKVNGKSVKDISVAYGATEYIKDYFVASSNKAYVEETPKAVRTMTITEVQEEGVNSEIYIKDYITNAFDEPIDALEALFNDSASGALAHYIGCILPDFIDPNNGYVSIDILFNSQSDIHHMMLDINNEVLTADYEESSLYEVLSTNATVNDTIVNKVPYTLEGYKHVTSVKPNSSSMNDKATWQKSILDVLIEQSGLRKALLSEAEIEYRYIVDSFETYPEASKELKSQLSLLAKEKELCFSILNFPSVRTMSTVANLKNSKGLFDVNKVINYLVLPSEVNGASFCAFYTPLKFSDGYVDTIVPSAGLVSNLFINKYANRQPYSIIAGPNYSNIQYSQLVGPDYHYSQEELHVIEPFGVNCMIYRPTFGTFINANQTAKQLPKSALSAINVRELVIYLQDAIGKVLQSYQWEFNNANTRAAIKTQADLICENAKFNGGIQAYVNVIDETNNTPDLIDQEFCVLSTSIEPGRGCGKMVHELTIYKTGGLSAVIKE